MKYILNGEDIIINHQNEVVTLLKPAKVKELVTCKDCINCITIPAFPDHPYCEGRMFGKCVDPEFFCADGVRK